MDTQSYTSLKRTRRRKSFHFAMYARVSFLSCTIWGGVFGNGIPNANVTVFRSNDEKTKSKMSNNKIFSIFLWRLAIFDHESKDCQHLIKLSVE